jgi:hypothetical protein
MEIRQSRKRTELACWAGLAGIVMTMSLLPCATYAQVGTSVIRVAPTGTDSPDCGSVGSPCATLQFAVDEFPDEGSGMILVAAGTYTSSDGQVVRVTLGKNLDILGGYSSDFNTRDPDTNLVTLDGQSTTRCVLVDPTPTLQDPELLLDGVTLRNGDAAPDQGILDAFGGGLSIFQGTLTLSNVRLIDNTASGLAASSGLPGNGGGGGLSIRQSTAVLTDVEITDNTAEGGSGSGSAVRGGLAVGGGVFAFESTLTLVRVAASGNIARAGNAPNSFGSDGGGQLADGLGGFMAAIRTGGSVAALTASGNEARGGQGSNSGGLGLGGALFIEDAPETVTIRTSTLSGNMAIGATSTANRGGLGGGGAIFATDSLVSLDAVSLLDNLAQGGVGAILGGDGGGGGLYMDSVLAQPAGVDATNVIVGRNTVTAGSGPTPGFAFGGGIFAQAPPGGASNDLTLTHATLAANVVSNATFNQGAAFFVSASATALSDFSIITDHTTPMSMDDRGEAVLAIGNVTLDHTLWNNNTLNFFSPGGTFVDNSPMTGAPDYVAPVANPPDYHILGTSAAIDVATGSTTPTDIDGGNRPFGASSDLGADEFGVPEPQSWLQQTAMLLTLVFVARNRRHGRTRAHSS